MYRTEVPTLRLLISLATLETALGANCNFHYWWLHNDDDDDDDDD
jgi:hypothetical protein